MARLKLGDVITVRAGLSVLDRRTTEKKALEADKICVVEGTRVSPIGTEDDHFEECFLVDARVLAADGTYDAAGELFSFATEGDFRSEFIQADTTVERRMNRIWVAE